MTHGPQKSPASIERIQAQTRHVLRELTEARMKVGDMVEVSGIEKRIELIGVKDGRTVLYCERDGEITIHEPCSVKVVPDQKMSQKRVDGRRAVE